ncbi:MAG: hypothetical protein Ct9H300mP28_05700 [Pseudomonadota bacterium]|nr:MAG: hypothetical protein Ct9H300mP28_05700 [Pseudomonadota bacterium]
MLKIPVIASGGGGTLDHFRDALTVGKADAVLAASVFHFGKFTVTQVKEYLKTQIYQYAKDDILVYKLNALNRG